MLLQFASSSIPFPLDVVYLAWVISRLKLSVFFEILWSHGRSFVLEGGTGRLCVCHDLMSGHESKVNTWICLVHHFPASGKPPFYPGYLLVSVVGEYFLRSSTFFTREWHFFNGLSPSSTPGAFLMPPSQLRSAGSWVIGTEGPLIQNGHQHSTGLHQEDPLEFA